MTDQDIAQVREALPALDFDARAAFERLLAEMRRLQSRLDDVRALAWEREEARGSPMLCAACPPPSGAPLE